MQNVLYVPDFRRNLLSVKKLEMLDFRLLFEKGSVKILGKNNDILGTGYRDNLYEISFKVLIVKLQSGSMSIVMRRFW